MRRLLPSTLESHSAKADRTISTVSTPASIAAISGMAAKEKQQRNKLARENLCCHNDGAQMVLDQGMCECECKRAANKSKQPIT